MQYRNLLLVALLIPRLEFLNIPGVNSGMRFDVVALAFVSILPIFLKVSKKGVLVILGVVILSAAQMLFFDAQVSRMVVGLILYLSIILFSQYHRIVSTEDVIHICRWFLVINASLHLFDMFLSVGGDHNFTGRYGLFNQHFAFASAMLVCYFFLYFHNARDWLVDGLFWSAFLLSGSRGLVMAVGLCLILANLNFVKNFRIYLVLSVALTALIAGVSYFAPENVHLQRMMLAYTLLVDGFSEVASILSDPAFNVRMANIYNYFEFVSDLEYSTAYMIVGGGPYSFLDYSVQYGKPGHFDNLYFRILSEYGLISLIFILSFMFLCVRRHSVTIWYIVAILIGAVVSEAVLTLKVGHLFFLTLFFLKEPNDKNT